MDFLCLPGLGCSSSSFANLRLLLEKNGHNVICMEWPGTGENRHLTVDQANPFDECVEMVVRETSTYKKLHIIAHSMGGAIALILAATDFSTKMGCLFNIEGNLIAEDCYPLSTAIANANFEELNSVIHLLEKKYRDSDEAGWQQWASEISQINCYDLQYYAKALVKVSSQGNLLRRFELLTIPKMYIVGETFDEGHPVLRSSVSIKNAVVKGAGHFLMVDCPIDTYSLIETYLNNNLRFEA